MRRSIRAIGPRWLVFLAGVDLTKNVQLINSIRISPLGEEEILVSVDTLGQTTVFYVNDLERRAMVLELVYYSKESFLELYLLTSISPTARHTRESTWGIAVSPCSKDPTIAVSSNSHRILVRNMANSSIRYLAGHSHNIPCIGRHPMCPTDASSNLY